MSILTDPAQPRLSAAKVGGAPCGPHLAARLYPPFRRLLELCFAIGFLIPANLVVALPLLVLNPILNPGPLFHRSLRMGQGCRPFHAYKYRTMRVAPGCHSRGPDDPVELDRVTRLGRFLRRSRFDELPQVLNVFRGEMSLIGPRPDLYHHARTYLGTIPGYRDRHGVRPGLSGLAQVELGYVEGRAATAAKTEIDLRYIRDAGLRLDLWIFWRTMRTVIDLAGR